MRRLNSREDERWRRRHATRGDQRERVAAAGVPGVGMARVIWFPPASREAYRK